MKVRYYADPDVRNWHEHAVELLRTIYDDHNIDVEIDCVEQRYGLITNFPGNVRHTTPQDVYERDLKSNHELIDAIDQRPSKAYKRSGKLDIAGNVAIVADEGTVRWASTLPGYTDGYGPDAGSQAAMDFLEDIAISPSNRVCVECLHLLDGDERFCPNCGCELP
ncbi:hypothetical protein [Natrinema pallidum]|uniref:DUF8045 domain-containing protein n=1 Tax=Natrinema pallidum DSM 3751 TaxID=1227495 RepID=L9YHC6_9EURY|nr:hypothetical protein [Natrinema pallidum]ELY73510.1 hypothetical protein C487_17175 [Natrinema pallidum DSM 3751]